MTPDRRSWTARLSRAVAAPICTLALLMALPAAPAAAQLSNLDKGMLVDGLANEGMSELLLHLVETEPSDDPVLDRLIEIAQYRIQYGDPGLDREEQLIAFDNALEGLRSLIKDYYDHEQRPIWQTDLAELLLIEYLQVIRQNAAEFYAFGVPTADQEQAYRAVVAEAFEAVSDADLRFFQLQGLLPRDADHTAKRVNTGLWTRMIDEYWKKRTQYYLGMSALFTSLLPDDAPYFANLGRNEKVRSQAATPDEERRRLAGLTIEKLKPFVDDASDLAGIRDPSMVLTGRAHNRLGQPDQALPLLDPVIASRQRDLADLTANLARADALNRQKQTSAAVDSLIALENHPVVKSNLLYRLLVTDEAFRFLLQQAASPAEVADAYEIYLDLLNAPELGEQADPLKNYIYTRWEQQLSPDADLSGLPPIVRMAIGEVARIEGQNLAVQAQQNGDADLEVQAQDKLQRAIVVNESLVGAGTPSAVLANARFNLALALYWSDPDSLDNLARVADLLVTAADESPDQPVADDAIAIGVDLLRSMHQATPRPAGIDEAYRRAARVLFEKYSVSPAADNERLYYGYAIEQLAGNYEAAIAQYERVPFDHPAYFDAQRERLFSMAELSKAGLKPWEQTAEEADRVLNAAQPAMNDADPERADAAMRALAGATLVLADADAAGGDADAAVQRLANFENRFAAAPDLVRLGYEKRIVTLVNGGRHDDAAREARAMMAAFPDDAAAVIDQVLTDLDTEIARLRLAETQTLVAAEKQRLENQAQSLAATAARLANVLAEWAAGQGFSEEEMLAFRLIQSKSLRLAGETDQALEVLRPLIAAFPDDAAVMSEYADTLFDVGDEASLINAAGYYDRLINGLGQPYPPEWWNAWLKRLTINDRLGENTEDIPLRVRQLQLTDPNLGGPAFKRGFDALEAKHSR